jgi:hypothetical protein
MALPIPPNSSGADELYRRLRRELDGRPIYRTAIEDCGISSEADARLAFDAFLQWFAAVAVLEDERLVMIKGPIDAIWHAYLLHTASYLDLCEYAGRFVHHAPQPGTPPADLVAATLALLHREFGRSLSPEFDRWEDLSSLSGS